MKLLLIIFMALSLTSCQETTEKVTDFWYDNFSLQKNIDMADENQRKEYEGDFKVDGFGYVFPPTVGRFVQNGFTYQASIAGEAYDENMENLAPGKTADVYLKKGESQIYLEASNDTSETISILDAPLTYIEISSFDISNMEFSVGPINFGDALYEMSAKVSDKDIIELRQNTKDAQNDQYYMYLNGEYVVIFTMYQGKLSQVEMIPNERLVDYEG